MSPGSRLRTRFEDFLDKSCGLSLARERVLEAATGHVLELGGETGANLALYPRTITSITSLVGSRKGQAVIRRAARHLPFSVDRREGPLEAMPVKDETYDTVVSTLALSRTARRAEVLHEIRRVLRPGGRLLFIEYGRSGDPAIARQQQRWAFLHRLLNGTQQPLPALDELVTEAGFDLRHFEENLLDRVPRGFGCLHEGIALAPTAP
jgi:ubiquinone/menaquinone biosynthesis C-methylase UbiE